MGKKLRANEISGRRIPCLTDDEVVLMIAEQRKLLEVEKARERKLEERLWLDYPHLGFVPNEAQVEFLEMVEKGSMEGVTDYGGFFGNGTGKTQLWPNLVWNLACAKEDRNKVFAGLKFVTGWKYPKRIRVICNAKQVKAMGAIDAAIHRWFPSGGKGYSEDKLGMDYVSLYGLPNGWSMDIMTPDQPKVLHESAEIGLLIVDEPISQELWHSYAARFRKGGFRMMFATLILESAWIQADIIENPKARWMFADIEKNCKQHAKGGSLEHEDIERMVANYPEEERDARRTGRPIHLRGRVFDFDRAVHTFDLEKGLPEGGTYMVVDPHQIRPWVITIFRLDAEGNYYWLDEWPRIDTEPWNTPYHKIHKDYRGLGDYAKLIVELSEKWNVDAKIIDSRFASQNLRGEFTSTNLRQQLEWTYGLYFENGNSAVRGETGGISTLKDKLRYDKSKTIDFCNSPHIFINKTLYNTCYQLENVTRKESGGMMTEDLEPKISDYVRSVLYGLTHHQTVHQGQVQDGYKSKWEENLMRRVAERETMNYA